MKWPISSTVAYASKRLIVHRLIAEVNPCPRDLTGIQMVSTAFRHSRSDSNHPFANLPVQSVRDAEPFALIDLMIRYRPETA